MKHNTIPEVPSSFDPEYARYLGYRDGLEYGTKDPNRNFKRGEVDPHGRNAAYFEGLAIGTSEARRDGLDLHCRVRWDNPAFSTPECGGRATHLGIAPYGPPHVLCLCDKHTAMAEECNRRAGTRTGFPEPWAIVPIEWV